MFSSGELRKIARDKLRGKWGMSILVTFLAGLLGGMSGGAGGGGGSNFRHTFNDGGGSARGAVEAVREAVGTVLHNPYFLVLISTIVGVILVYATVVFFVGAAVELGHCAYYIDLINNGRPGVGVLFSRFTIFWKALGLRLFMMLFIFLWMLLFIIPGIIAAYRYAMAPYIMAQNPDIGIREAVDQSKAMMQGHKGRLFILGLSFIGWALLCILTLGIGFLWLNPYVQAAGAAFYLERSGHGIPLPE